MLIGKKIMKLNLQILKEELLPLKFESSYRTPAYARSCVYTRICEKKPESLSEHVIYLLKAENLPSVLKIKDKNYSFICLGIPKKAYREGICNLLYLPDPEMDLITLQNGLQEIFYKYNKWETDVMDAVSRKLSIKTIADYTVPFCPNPISCYGSGFRAIFHVDPEATRKTPEYYKAYIQEYGSCEPGNFIPPDEINLLMADPSYSTKMNQPEPFIYPGDSYGFRTLCANASINGQIIARLCINEILAPLTDRDTAVITILADFVTKAMHTQDIYKYNRPKDLDKILENLLNRHFVQEKKIDLILQSYGWNISDTYVCFCLRSKIQEELNYSLYSLAVLLSDYFYSNCYTVYNNQIVFIVNLTRIRTDKETLLRNTISLFRDNLLEAGISTDFTDFKELYYYFTQASWAIEIGKRKNPDFWYFRFEDYNLDYLIRCCTGKLNPYSAIPLGLKKLIAYDEKNLSDYTHSLKVYLQNDRNIAETVRELFIHRNTFIYRLERIQAISGLDLNDYDTRLLLEISFAILEEKSQEISG